MEYRFFVGESPAFFNALAEVIVERKIKKELTPKDIADRTGISEGYILDLLSGNQKMTLDDVVLITRALGVTAHFLINEAKRSARSDKGEALAVVEVIRRTSTQKECAQAKTSKRTLGLRFVRSSDPIVDRDDKEALKRLQAERVMRMQRMKNKK